MCIVNRLSKEKVEEYKKELPEEFVVYRCITDRKKPLYHNQENGEPNSTTPGVHKAECWPDRRDLINYTPGFHVFRTRSAAERYIIDWFCATVVPIKIRKSWIQEIGNCVIWDGLSGMKGQVVLKNEDVFVCSYIKVEGE